MSNLEDLAAQVAQTYFEEDMKVPACERKALLQRLVLTALRVAADYDAEEDSDE